MTGLTLATLGFAFIFCGLTFHYQNLYKEYHSRWEDTVRGMGDKLIYEWSVRDLTPLWEEAYPHVVDMQTHRKYSEWLTFCANYPTRNVMEVHLEEHGARIEFLGGAK